MSQSSQLCPKCGGPITADAPQGLCPKCLLQQASFPTETGPATRHSRPIPPTRDELAAAFPHLEILELIGQGGMGFVFKARQPKLDRLVALKILAQPLAEQSAFAERFTREGRTLAKLNHPNIVTIHDFGQAGPFFYLLMEFVDGVNLRQAMRAGAINPSQALAIVPKICDALQYAHNEGVLHRDIKPDNILMDTRGRVKIADFGIAKLMAEAVADNPLTGSGASLGTPHYMAPEQIERPNAVDHRADIFSLGVVFYEMLTGELPIGRFAPPSQKSNADPRLDDIVFQTLEKQPERRPQSADEVRTRVEGVSTAAPPSDKGVPAPVGAFRTSRCYISTPEFLRTLYGKLALYSGKGELRLDEENLVFTHQHQSVVMPLRAITTLTRGQYPRLTKPGGLDYIAVTFQKGSAPSRLLLTPHKGPFSPTWETNTIVHDWLNAIQQAVKNKTGCLPENSPQDLEPLPNAIAPQFGPAFAKWLTIVLVPLLIFLCTLWALRNLASRNEQAPPRAAVNAPSEPGRQLENLVLSSGTTSASNLSLRLETSTEPRFDESFVPVIRYGNGPWGEADNAAQNAVYHRGSERPPYQGTYTWNLPPAFNSGFETAAAVMRARAAAAERAISVYTNHVTPIFELTNASAQSVAVGLRIAKRPPIAPAANPVATLTRIPRPETRNPSGAFNIHLSARAEVPPGYRLQAVGLFNGREVPTTSQLDTFFSWTVPDRIEPSVYYSDMSPFIKVSDGPVEIPWGHRLEIFSIERDDYVFTGSIELVALPGVTPPPRPVAPSAKPAAPAPVVETVELTLVNHIVAPRTIRIFAEAALALDQNVYALFGDLAAPAPSRRLPRSGRQSLPIPIPGMSGSHNSSPVVSQWRTIRGATNAEIGELIWNFSDRFSLERDLVPAMKRLFENSGRKTIRVSSDSATNLFAITNAFGEVAVGALRFSPGHAAVRDPSAGVNLKNLRGHMSGPFISLELNVAYPPKARLEAIARNGGQITTSEISRFGAPEGTASIRATWQAPEGFHYTEKMVSLDAANLPEFLKPFGARTASGDAWVSPGKPLEVFALTNSEGKVFRALLEVPE